MQILMRFYEGKLKQQMLYNANFLYPFLIHLKWRSSSSNFPKIQQALGPQLQRGRKIPAS